MAELAQFHFLRPGWLLLFPVVVLLWWSLVRAHDGERSWRAVMAPHLLDHLLVRHGRRSRGPKPETLLGLAWLLAVVALAGPAWQRQSSPFSQDQAALVIALKVTPEMLARDVPPSRLERSVQKIRDLLALRRGARTALVAYAGSAHLVMPLTTDPEILETFAVDLSPDIMPADGDAAADAVALANRLLEGADAVGSILLVADAVAEDQLEGLRRARGDGGVEVHVLAVAAGPEAEGALDGPPAPALDPDAMVAAARAGGGTLRTVTVDGADVRALSRAIATSLVRAPAREGERWRDDGYLLVPLIAVLVLPLFRRGGAAVAD